MQFFYLDPEEVGLAHEAATKTDSVISVIPESSKNSSINSDCEAASNSQDSKKAVNFFSALLIPVSFTTSWASQLHLISLFDFCTPFNIFVIFAGLLGRYRVLWLPFLLKTSQLHIPLLAALLYQTLDGIHFSRCRLSLCAIWSWWHGGGCDSRLCKGPNRPQCDHMHSHVRSRNTYGNIKIVWLWRGNYWFSSSFGACRCLFIEFMGPCLRPQISLSN